MNRLHKSLTKIIAAILLIGSSISSHATELDNRSERQVLPVIADVTITKNVRQLIKLGDSYTRLGQIELAIEHYSRSVRLGKLVDPSYQDPETQSKIVALLKQQQAEKAELAVKQLIWRGDDNAATQPQQALEYYSKSIRVGKLYDAQYQDLTTQKKIIKLVNILGAARK